MLCTRGAAARDAPEDLPLGAGLAGSEPAVRCRRTPLSSGVVDRRWRSGGVGGRDASSTAAEQRCHHPRNRRHLRRRNQRQMKQCFRQLWRRNQCCGTLYSRWQHRFPLVARALSQRQMWAPAPMERCRRARCHGARASAQQRRAASRAPEQRCDQPPQPTPLNYTKLTQSEAGETVFQAALAPQAGVSERSGMYGSTITLSNAFACQNAGSECLCPSSD